MADLIWRRRANIAGYVDCVYQIIGTLFFIGFCVYFRPEYAKLFEKHERGAGSVWIISLVIIVVIALVVEVLVFTLAVKLIIATNSEEYDKPRARSAATWWRNANIVFLVFSLFGILRGHLISVLISVLIRGPMIYVVHQYIVELETVMAAPSSYVVDDAPPKYRNEKV